MLRLPKATEISQALPKKTIFAKFDLKSAQREHFDEDISRMQIVNAISQTTIPTLQKGNDVECIYIVEVMLKKQDYDPKNLLLLSKLIPQKMLFALHYDGKLQLAIFHSKLITGAWQNEDTASLQLQGFDLDEVWDNLVMDVGSIELEEDYSLEAQIAADEAKAKLQREIDQLEKKARSEKQPRKKLELYEELRIKQRELLKSFQK